MTPRRKGKIARLPRAVREEINVLLHDGAATYQQIIEKLGLADQDIKKENVGEWRIGGYQDWVLEQERLAEMKARRETSVNIVKDNLDGNPHETVLQLAAAQIYDTLKEFDATRLKELLDDRPEHYTQVVNAVVRVSKSAVEIEKMKLNVSEQKRKIEAELGKLKTDGGLAPETLEKIEEALKLL